MGDELFESGRGFEWPLGSGEGEGRARADGPRGSGGWRDIPSLVLRMLMDVDVGVWCVCRGRQAGQTRGSGQALKAKGEKQQVQSGQSRGTPARSL